MIELNTVIQGDCLEVMNDIKDGSVDLILCDLPYVTTQNKWDSVIHLPSLWGHYKRIIKDNGVIVLTSQFLFSAKLMVSNEAWFKYNWVWKKGNKPTGFLNAKKQPLRIHEDILVFYDKQGTYNPQMVKGEKCHSRGKTIGTNQNRSTNYGLYKDVETNGDLKYPQTIIDIPRDDDKFHPTQKPVALFEYLIETYSNVGEVVLDNCAGSFTTALACDNTKRNWICIDDEEEHCEIGRNRIKENRLRLQSEAKKSLLPKQASFL